MNLVIGMAYIIGIIIIAHVVVMGVVVTCLICDLVSIYKKISI